MINLHLYPYTTQVHSVCSILLYSWGDWLLRRHHLVFLLAGLCLKLVNGRLSLSSGSGILLDLVKRRHRREIWGLGGWDISSQLPPCFGMESLVVVSLLQVSSSFWEARSFWLQISFGSRTTISSLYPFSPRGRNGFPLLLVSKYVIVPYLFPYPYPPSIRILKVVNNPSRVNSVSYWVSAW